MVGQAYATVFLFVLVGLGLAVPILIILNAWIVEQSLEGGVAAGLIAALLVALIAIWSSQGTAWVFVWIGGVIAICVALPALTSQRDRRALRHLAEENIERYRRTIQGDPKNAGAWAYLADAYVECGRYDDAIAAYQTSIDLDPSHSQRERAKLRQAMDAKQGQRRTQIRVCDHCQGENPAGRPTCGHCGARIQMGFLEWLAQPETIKTVTRRSVPVLLLLAVLYASFSALPLEVKGCVIIASVLVGAFYMLRSVGGG